MQKRGVLHDAAPQGFRCLFSLRKKAAKLRGATFCNSGRGRYPGKGREKLPYPAATIPDCVDSAVAFSFYCATTAKIMDSDALILDSTQKTQRNSQKTGFYRLLSITLPVARGFTLLPQSAAGDAPWLMASSYGTGVAS
ncbi:MAG TPA: hypothetical protein VIJ79_00160 [Acidobacteriaceae bacterium]